MKALKTLFAVLLATAFVFGFASCKSDDDDSGSGQSYETPTANLPESVGTNELAGKTWELNYNYGSIVTTWKFDNDTFEKQEKDGRTWIYRYTYNSNTKIIYYALKSFTTTTHYTNAANFEVTLASVQDWVNN